jgi:6-phosphogluconate dehydrogenase (decarboxylating)
VSEYKRQISEKYKMGKGGNHLQNANQEIKELQDSLHCLKDKLIKALQQKLIEKEKQIENMVDATCTTNDLIQMVDDTCDTNDLVVDAETTKYMVDNSLTSHDMKSYSKVIKISLVEDESQA